MNIDEATSLLSKAQLHRIIFCAAEPLEWLPAGRLNRYLVEDTNTEAVVVFSDLEKGDLSGATALFATAIGVRTWFYIIIKHPFALLFRRKSSLISTARSKWTRSTNYPTRS